MLDQFVLPTIRAIEISTGRIDRAEIASNQSMSDHATQMTELLNDVLRAWREECVDVMQGDKPPLDPAATKKLLGSLIEASRRGPDIFRTASALLSHEISGMDEMRHAFAKIERLHARLLERWHTPEDLEDIAAEELAPSAEQLDAVAARHGFPQAWYDEDSKPF